MKEIKFKPTDRQAKYLQEEATRLGISRQELLRRILDRVMDEVAPSPGVTFKENPADLWAAARKFILAPDPTRVPDGVYLYAAPMESPGIMTTTTGDSIDLPPNLWNTK